MTNVTRRQFMSGVTAIGFRGMPAFASAQSLYDHPCDFERSFIRFDSKSGNGYRARVVSRCVLDFGKPAAKEYVWELRRI